MESTERHRKWQDTLDRKAFFDEVFSSPEQVSNMDDEAFFTEKAKVGDIDQALAVLDKVADGEVRRDDEVS